jgi:two-component system OmpR family response regulator
MEPGKGQKMTATILVIGQGQWDAESFRTALTQAGYSVAAAETQAATATIQYYRPALIITCLSGNEPADLNLCRKLVDIGNAPIIAVGFPQDTECQLAAFDAGVDDYLSRPVNLPELIARVRGILHRISRVPSARSASNISTPDSFQKGIQSK